MVRKCWQVFFAQTIKIFLITEQSITKCFIIIIIFVLFDKNFFVQTIIKIKSQFYNQIKKCISF